MTDPVSQHPAPWWRAWRRAAIAVAVLLGLFLMHGMSASAGSECNGPYAQTALGSQALAATTTTPALSAGSPTLSASGPTAIERCACDASMGTSCVPLAQRGPGALLALLLLALAWVSVPRPGPLRTLSSMLRRAGQARPRATVRTLTCVSRT